MKSKEKKSISKFGMPACGWVSGKPAPEHRCLIAYYNTKLNQKQSPRTRGGGKNEMCKYQATKTKRSPVYTESRYREKEKNND